MQEALLRRFFAPMILFVIAYEWLISGLNKLLSGNFVGQLGKTLSDGATTTNFTFYGHLLNTTLAPHATVLGVLVITGEIVVGVAFIILAFAFIFNNTGRSIAILGVITGVISTFMALNFMFFQGGAFFLNPSDPSDEGIPIDAILIFMQIGIAIFYVGMWIATRRTAERESFLKLSNTHTQKHPHSLTANHQ